MRNPPPTWGRSKRRSASAPVFMPRPSGAASHGRRRSSCWGMGPKGSGASPRSTSRGTTEIVDLYPGREHLAKVAKLRFGVRAVQSPEWLSARRDELDDGKVEAVIAAMSQPPVPDNGPQEEVQKEREYFRGNAERMRYAEFRSQGLFVGSGVVEAGCKTIFGQRLKLSGMHWTVRGANAIIALRCYQLSGRWEEFWESCAANQ